jgi:hypothetical protein
MACRIFIAPPLLAALGFGAVSPSIPSGNHAALGIGILLTMVRALYAARC